MVDVGKPLTMTVPYDAYPRAEAEWLKEEENLPTTTVDTTNDCTTFKIHEAKKSDKGRYKVILRNKHGQAEAFINVEVIGKYSHYKSLACIYLRQHRERNRNATP